ncbi:MAG TPA: serine hydrolase domain-containing protein [Symbiobacteriaceae bacterium]|nr:serine hydrolase domain-containing protein [Symbiobacteriaceae bacterium]
MARPRWIRELEAFAGEQVLAEKTPGLAMGFAMGGQPVYQAGFGWRDAERGLPITTNTVFGIGSITKSFTAIAIMQLQEQGKLSVHDPVVKHLPEFRTPNPEYARATTIHHFLTHTAGIPPLPTLFAVLRDSLLADPLFVTLSIAEHVRKLPTICRTDELMTFLADQAYTPLGAPGACFSYCNDTYMLLGVIIERLSGRPYTQYISEHILWPAGMTRSTFGDDEAAVWDDVAQLYDRMPSGEVTPAPGFHQGTFPAADAAGHLKSTVPDLLRYMEVFRTGGRVGQATILRPESVQGMMAPHFALGPDEHYGYGLFIRRGFKGVTLVEHGGTIKGVKASVLCVPEQAFTGALLANIDNAPVSRVAHGAVHAYLGYPTDTPIFDLVETECDSAQIKEYEGEFAMGGAPLVVRVVEGRLEAKSGEETYHLRHVQKDLFLMKFAGTDETVTFLRDGKGRIDAVFFHLRTVPRR